MPGKLIRFCAVAALMTIAVFIGGCSNEDKEDTSKSVPPPSPQATTSSAKPSPYYGAIDYRDCDFVKGWVYNGANPNEDIKVSLYIDDKLIETMPAKTLRADVKAQKIGTGLYGYSFKIPANLKDNLPHTVSVKTVGSDYTLIVPQGIYATAACKP